jgi:hypothetical protein
VQLSLAALLDMLCIILRRLGEDRQGHGASADGPGNGPDEMARLSAVGGPDGKREAVGVQHAIRESGRRELMPASQARDNSRPIIVTPWLSHHRRVRLFSGCASSPCTAKLSGEAHGRRSTWQTREQLYHGRGEWSSVYATPTGFEVTDSMFKSMGAKTTGKLLPRKACSPLDTTAGFSPLLTPARTARVS